MSQFFGSNFVPLVGVVEDRKDPLHMGRCKVRYFGRHTADKMELPTEMLPWSIPLRPLDNGQSTKPPIEGTYILGFFLDGEESQEPVMLGSFMGYPENKAKPDEGFYDPRTKELYGHKVPDDPLVRIVNNKGEAPVKMEKPKKENFPRIRAEPKTSRLERPSYPTRSIVDHTIVKFKKDAANANKVKTAWMPEMVEKKNSKNLGQSVGSDNDIFSEPPTPYAAKYPYNRVYHSEGENIFEIDDTPNAERIHLYHRSGSFDEFHTNGTRVVKTVNDFYSYTNKNRFEHTGKNKVETINGSYKVKVNDSGQAGGHYILQVGPNGNLDLVLTEGNLNIYSMKGDSNIVINGDATTVIEKDYTLKVGGKFSLDVLGSMYQTVGGRLSQVTKGNKTETVGGSLHETFQGYCKIAYTKESGLSVPSSLGDAISLVTGASDVSISYSGSVESKYHTNFTEDVSSNHSVTVGGDCRHNLNDYNIVLRNNMSVTATGTNLPGEFILDYPETGKVEFFTNGFYNYSAYTYFSGRKFEMYMTRMIQLATTFDVFDLVFGDFQMFIQGNYLAVVESLVGPGNAAQGGMFTYSTASTTFATASGLYSYK